RRRPGRRPRGPRRPCRRHGDPRPRRPDGGADGEDPDPRHPVALPRQPHPRGQHPRHLDPHPAQQAERIRRRGDQHSGSAIGRRLVRLRGRLTVSPRMDRRSVLAGLAVSSLAACARAEPAATETPAAAPESLDLSALEGDGRLGFVAHDLGSGRRLAWRGEERFVYCSTFKMYLAAATFLRVQAGEERLDRAVPVTAADMINHAPVTAPAVGASLTVQELMKGTVEVSDNPAANLLLKAMGGLEPMQAF